MSKLANLFRGQRPRPERQRVKPKTWLDPEEDSFIPPRDLWINLDDSITHYARWIWEYLAYLTIVAGLERHDAVLDLGCGHGRIARGLLCYMRAPGRYVGLDIHARRIADARQRFTARYPNFQFVLADVRSREYNPAGSVDAASYTFPFDDQSFDVIFAASLFTHLLPAETARYFQESARVLRDGGRCLFSVFLLDYYRGPGTTISRLYEFPHELPGHAGIAVREVAFPDAAIAYRLDALNTLAAQAGLCIERVLPGLWSDGSGWAAHEQDLLLLARRPGRGAPAPIIGYSRKSSVTFSA